MTTAIPATPQHRRRLRSTAARHEGLLIVALIAGLAASGCDQSWDRLNRGGLRRDLERLCAANNVKVRAQNCRMEGTTRDGACTIRLSSDDARRLVQGLGLVRPDTLPADDLVAVATRRIASVCCRGSVSDEVAEIYAAFGRPPALRLPSGTAFEHMVVVYWPLSGTACLCAGYAYG